MSEDSGAVPWAQAWGLLEREQALEAIESVLVGARAGRGRALVFVGEAGLGKSALLQAARTVAAEAVPVYRAGGSPLEHDLPLAFAEQLLGPLDSASAGQPGDPQPGDPQPGDPLSNRSALHRVALQRLRALAGAGSLVLLDDLHFADPDSVSIVAFLARRLGALPVAMVGALRPWPPQPLRAAELLAHEGAVELVELEPLSDAASNALLARIAGDSPEEDLRVQALQLARGNPLFVTEIARSMRSGGSVPSPRIGDLGPRRRALLVGQLAGLPPASLSWARVAALLGGRFSIALVTSIAGIGRGDLAGAFDPLVASGLVVHRGDGTAELSHDLIASAIAEDMGPAEREVLHHRAFEHFYDRGELALACPHAVAAHLQGDPRATAALLASGVKAFAEGAVETALELLASAVSLSEPDPSDEVLEAHADALFAAGHSAGAAAIYARLLQRGSQGEEGLNLVEKSARAIAYTGDLDEALGAYDRALGMAGPPGQTPLSLVLERAHVVWEKEGPAGALDHLDQVLQSLEGAGAALGHLVGDFFAFEAGDPSGMEAIEAAARGVRRIAAAHATEAIASFNAVALYVDCLGAIERFDEALEWIDFGCSWLIAAGAPRSTVPLRIVRLGVLQLQGRPFDVISEADDMEEELHLDALSEPHVVLFRSQAQVVVGRHDQAAAGCEQVARMPGADTWYAAMNLEMTRAQCLVARGAIQQGAEGYLEAERLARRYGAGEPCHPPWAGGAIEAHLRAGNLEDVERVAAWVDRQSARLPCQGPRMIAAGARAGLAVARGHRNCDEEYRAALDLPGPNPLDWAGIALRYGSWLRRHGRPAAARPILARASQRAEERGATPLATSAQAELAAAGGRRGRPKGSLALSAQERRVATEASRGATTREIASLLYLSPRTVESHLGAAYRKLGVASRRELILHAGELDLERPLPGTA